MAKITSLTPEQKAEWLVYCRKYKHSHSRNLLRNFIIFAIEEEHADEYYLIWDKVTNDVDYTTSNKEALSKKAFEFIGYGKHIWSDDDKGNPDKRLLKFYKENPDKIPDFHKEIFETLTASKKTS